LRLRGINLFLLSFCDRPWRFWLEPEALLLKGLLDFSGSRRNLNNSSWISSSKLSHSRATRSRSFFSPI
ncbi:unnamed protein product, partial [Mycena citricolor]